MHPGHPGGTQGTQEARDSLGGKMCSNTCVLSAKVTRPPVSRNVWRVECHDCTLIAITFNTLRTGFGGGTIPLVQRGELNLRNTLATAANYFFDNGVANDFNFFIFH